jgi:hypothetical protein
MEPVDREELEHIPWARLAEAATPDRARLYVLGAVAAAALAVGMLGARVIGADSAGEPQPPAAAPVVVATSAPVATTLPGTTPPEPALYSEADLMAVLPDEEIRLAVASAETFVTDFFTVDGNGATTDALHEYLSDEVLALLPHGRSTSTSYVEWARAVAVESAEPGRYDIVVQYRTLSSALDGSFNRSPSQAVIVRLSATATGMTITDLPAPTALPALGATRLPDPETADQATIDAALTRASEYGGDPELVAASRTSDGWRVIVTVAGPGDIRWPLRVDVG